jgi:hypothetical protein
MDPLSVFPLLCMFFLFIIGVSTKITFVFVLLGPLFIWFIRLNFRRPDALTAITAGANAAFWAYIALMVIDFIFYHIVRICPTIICGGLLIVPLLSGLGAFLVNLWPASANDNSKPDFAKFFKRS